MSRPKVPEGVSCSQLQGPSLVLKDADWAGSCNGCDDRHKDSVWVVALQGIQVRLCDDCFDSLIAQREEQKKIGRRA